MPQIDLIVRDNKLRQTIVDNARQFVETNYSEKVEFSEYARLAAAMSRLRESETKAASETDDTPSEKLTENLSSISEEQEHVENETLHKELKNNATEKVGDSGRAETADATKNVSTSVVKGGAATGKNALKQTAARTASNGPKKSKLTKLKSAVNVVSDVAFMKQQAAARTASDTGVRSPKTNSDIRAPDAEQNKPETSDVASKPDPTLQTDAKQNGEDQTTKEIDDEKMAANVSTDIAAAKTPSSRRGSTVRAVSIVAKKTRTAKLKAAVNVLDNVASSEHGSTIRTASDTVVQLQKAAPDDEKNKAAACESASKPDSMTETDGKEPSKTENGEDHATNTANAVEKASEEVWANPVRDIAAETTRSPRGGAAGKSGGKTTAGSKKVPVKGTGKPTNRQTRRMSVA